MKETILTPKYQILSGTAIQLPAAVFMFFDHIHEMFYWHGAPIWLTMLGRPVFPLFLFMSAEAFHYTRDRKKCLRRLLAGTWVMAVITTVLQRVFPMNDVILINNAFSTFFVAALWMDAYVNFRNRKNARAIAPAILLFIRSPGNIQWMMAFAAVPMPYTDVPCTGSGAFSYVLETESI